MAQAINLLPQIAEQEIQRGVYKKKINLVAIAALLIVFVVALALFSWQLFLSTRAKAIEENSAQREKEISEQFDKEIKQQALIDKLEAVKAYLDKNKSTATSFQEIINLAAVGSVTLSKVEINSAGEISVSGSASNSSDLGKLFDNLTKEGAQVNLDKLVASSLSLSAGSYQFTIRLSYTKNGIINKESKNETE